METKSNPATENLHMMTAMATKSKRAKFDSRKTSEKVCDDQLAVVTRLQSELELERKSSKQLRREKALEVQQVREAEQNRSTASQKELATKLHQEKQRELEALRDSLRCKHEAEVVKAIKQKDLEIRRLQRDLRKCQEELKEEIAKRGLSTSARSAFETERAKLLQEIKELTGAKKQLEDALRTAMETEKQKNYEIRQLQENCRLEVAKVEKEAGLEVRKLLEELKSKDHLLAQMDRNQYPDRSQTLRQHLANQSVDELRNLSKELENKETKKQETNATPSSPITGLQSIGWQKKIYELEKQIRAASGLNHAFIEKNKEITTINQNLEGKIKNLTEENKELNCELTSAKADMRKMTELFKENNLESLSKQLEKLRKQMKEQELIIAQLRFECQEKDRIMRLKARENRPKKAVRFLLPGETVPLAPGFDIDDVISIVSGHHGDDSFDSLSITSSSSSDTTIQSSQPSLSDVNLTNDDRELLEPEVLLESVEKDYEQLMREHLTLEQSYASLLHSYSARVEGEPPPDEWKIEREALNLAIYALEQKVRRCEENEQLLRVKLEQITEEKEELEFKVLEHEECYERVGGEGAEKGQEQDADLLEKNQKLESELIHLQKKLEKYEHSGKIVERDVSLRCNWISDVEKPSDTQAVGVKFVVTSPSNLELSGSCDNTEDESTSEMGLSLTSSSGFDETSSEAEDPGSGCDSLPKSLNQKTSLHLVTSRENDILQREKDDKREEHLQEMESIIKNFQEMEVVWKGTVDKLERQLQQSFLRERIIRDQMALVEEEKNRRINALQGQIELLEDNEDRLSETIHALENVALGVDGLESDVMNSVTVIDELHKDDKEMERRRKQLREEVEELVEAGRILGQVKLHFANQVKRKNSTEATDETSTDVTMQPGGVEVIRLVAEVEKALKSSIVHLENVNQQLGEEARKEKELGNRIQKLETDVWKNKEEEGGSKLLSTSQSRQAVVEDSKLVSAFAVEELQSDLRELRGLLIRLKAVINMDEIDNQTSLGLENSQGMLASCLGNKEIREKLHLDILLDVSKGADDWLAITPPGVRTFNGKFGERDNDTTEFQLRQKVDELEKDVERLQKLVHEEEQVVRDLHFKNLELKSSKKNLQQVVERLETSEEQMSGKMEEIAEEMEKLQIQVKQLETRERLAKSQVTKHQENEAELEERLEQVMEEMQRGKLKMERKIWELENEKKVLVQKTEEQADRIGDLEGLSSSLKSRIKNLETSETSLRNEMRKLEAELSSAAGQLSELEQQKESLAQHLQDLEKEKSKLLFEIADLTMDSNKQGHKITLLNQEIAKIRGSLINKDEVISCLQAKLEEVNAMLDGLRIKLTEYESLENDLMEELSQSEDNKINNDQKFLKAKQLREQSLEFSTNQQSTQTNFSPLKARIIIEKATPAFRESLLSLGERHPEILCDFLSASLLPLLASHKNPTSVPEEIMKRFITSLQVDLLHDVKVTPQENMQYLNGRWENAESSGHVKEEEKQWEKVEDLRILHDVRDAVNSNYWKGIEKKMGLHTEDLALTIEFKDMQESKLIQQVLPHNMLRKSNELIKYKIDPSQQPPPLPDSSPPPLSPEPHLPEEYNGESADEASEIHDEDDGAFPLGDSIASDWKVPYRGATRRTDPSLSLSKHRYRPKSSVSAAEPSTNQMDSRYLRAQSVDRDFSSPNQNAFRGLGLHRMVTGSFESITDSGMDSMRHGTSMICEEAFKQKTKKMSMQNEIYLEDRAIQTTGEESFEPVIVLRTQLEQKEKELTAKSNEMDRLSQEMRRWQQEAVIAGEEKARLSALLGRALKDLRVVQETSGSSSPDVKSPSSASVLLKVPKVPLGSPVWGSSGNADKIRPVSHIPVSIRHSSLNSEIEFALKCQSSSTARRPTSLYSELSHSSSSSTDGAPHSDPCSNYASPSQDCKSVSYLPRPVKDFGSNVLPSMASLSSHREADRLFQQSLDSSRNSQNKQSASSSSQTGSVGDVLNPLHAVEPATSRTTGATPM